jgi:LEA14-like dessication related protein
MIKKTILTLILLFIVVLGLFLICRYLGYARDKNPYKTFLLPRLELSEIDITSLTSEKTEMKAKMLIENHIPISFTADSLQYKIFINGTEVMNDQYEKSITLKGNDTSSISLPITIFNRSIISVLNVNEQKNIDSAEFSFHITFFTHIPFKKHFDIEIKKFLPLIYIPEAKLDHMEISSLSFSGAVVKLLISINNRNVFPLNAKNIAYEFSIEGNQWINGTIPGIMDIRSKNITAVTIPIKVSFKEVGKTLFDLLTKGNNVKYALHLTFRNELGNDMMKNSKVIFESAGTVKSVMKAL